MSEKENTKLSLYFKKETMNELTKLKDLLILTGLPSNELPDMNEFINGIISYAKEILKEYPAERERLHEFTKGHRRKTTREDKIEKLEIEEETEENENKETQGKDSGTARFLYRITEEEKDNLNQIKNLSKTEMTDPTLIRTTVEFCLQETIDKISILMYTFIGTLYSISPKTTITLYFLPDNDLEQIKNISAHDKEALRKITWDHGSFETFKKAIETEKKWILALNKGKLTGGKLLWIFGIRPKTYNKILKETESKASKFNYMTAYAGLAMIYGMIDNEIQTIPEALTQINTMKNYTAKKLIDLVSYLITLSDRINNNPEI